jgi:hypothetical protein
VQLGDPTPHIATGCATPHSRTGVVVFQGCDRSARRFQGGVSAGCRLWRWRRGSCCSLEALHASRYAWLQATARESLHNLCIHEAAQAHWEVTSSTHIIAVAGGVLHLQRELLRSDLQHVCSTRRWRLRCEASWHATVDDSVPGRL